MDGGFMEGPGEGEALRDQLAEAIGRDRFDLWLTGGTRLEYQAEADRGGRIAIVFESRFMCDTARRNIGDELQAAARKLYGAGTALSYRVVEPAEKPALPSRSSAKAAAAAQPAAATHPAAATAPADRHGGREPATGTFASLVVGKCNELAARAGAGLAAGKHAGGPLVVWGPPGCGKTHLLSAIKHAYRAQFRRARVLSLSAEQFVGHYVEALRGGGLPSFRQKYRGANLLLIDDMHFMAGKRATLEELQHTIDRVTAAGGQVVIASCHEPGRIANLSDELLSRLRAGLVCEIAPADYATRLEIARRRCREYALPVDEQALSGLAAGVSTGTRELLGAIERLRARHQLLGDVIDAALVEQTAGEINRQTIRPMAMDDIQKAVCEYFGVEAKALRSSSRHKSVTEPRMLAMWLARKYTQAGWREIGEYFGGRRHSTVIAAHRRIESQIGRETPIRRGQRHCNLEEAVGQIETALRTA